MSLKGDEIVNHALDSRIERESASTKRFSTIVAVDSIFQENIEKMRINLPGENIDNKKETNYDNRS